MTLRDMRLGNAKLHSCRCGSPSEPRSPWLGVFEVPTPSDCSVFPRAINWFSNLQREWSCDTLSETQEDKPSNIWLSGTLCHGRTKLKRIHKQRCVLQNAITLTGKSRLDIWCPDAVNHLHPHLDTWFLNLCWESKGMCITYKCGTQI